MPGGNRSATAGVTAPGGSPGPSPSGGRAPELAALSESALRNNAAVVEYCRTSMAALAGSTAGFMISFTFDILFIVISYLMLIVVCCFRVVGVDWFLRVRFLSFLRVQFVDIALDEVWF